METGDRPPGAGNDRIAPENAGGEGVAGDLAVLDRLFRVIESRRDADPEKSYVARLLRKGPAKLAQKVGEEAVETAIAAAALGHQALVEESADLLFHLLVLWVGTGVQASEVWAELARREGTSGVDVKKARPKA